MILIEIGDDPHQLGSPARLASWSALLSTATTSSAGKRKSDRPATAIPSFVIFCARPPTPPRTRPSSAPSTRAWSFAAATRRRSSPSPTNWCGPSLRPCSAQTLSQLNYWIPKPRASPRTPRARSEPSRNTGIGHRSPLQARRSRRPQADPSCTPHMGIWGPSITRLQRGKGLPVTASAVQASRTPPCYGSGSLLSPFTVNLSPRRAGSAGRPGAVAQSPGTEGRERSRRVCTLAGRGRAAWEGDWREKVASGILGGNWADACSHKPPFEATTKSEKLAVVGFARPVRRQRNAWANFVVGVTAASSDRFRDLRGQRGTTWSTAWEPCAAPARALSEQRQVVCVGRSERRPKRRLGREGAPLGQRGGAPLFVNLAGDEMALLIEMVVDLGMN